VVICADKLEESKKPEKKRVAAMYLTCPECR
jgi:hypothetical protein